MTTSDFQPGEIDSAAAEGPTVHARSRYSQLQHSLHISLSPSKDHSRINGDSIAIFVTGFIVSGNSPYGASDSATRKVELEFSLDDGDQDIGGDVAPNLRRAAFLEDGLRQSSNVVGHFTLDVRWRGLKRSLLQFELWVVPDTKTKTERRKTVSVISNRGTPLNVQKPCSMLHSQPSPTNELDKQG